MDTLTTPEYNRIVYDCNQSDKVSPRDKTIHTLFDKQVQQTPDHIAVVYENYQLTYQQLNDQANQLARLIRQYYTKPELIPNTLIAIYLDRSPDMILAILGILKAGAAYVPIDPESPQQRTQYLLQDTPINLVLTHDHLKPTLYEINTQAQLSLNLISLDLTPHQNYSAGNLPIDNQTSDYAYVIYTSGTTGQPKGTPISHQNLTNLVTLQKEALSLNCDTRVLQYASIIFDASVWEIFSTLIYGGQLFIVPNSIRQDAIKTLEFIDNEQINIATLPPALLASMPYRPLPHLHTLVLAGESASQDLMTQWAYGRKLINAYGLTETTVCATLHVYQPGDSNTNIGKPVNNTRVYVLDSNHHSVPEGTVGELHIGGAGIAQGYLNRPELTQQRFIDNPFATQQDINKGYTRLYKTGDLARWLPDGSLEYVGRNDFQVKIRGFRVELGEIERALLTYSAIQQVCTLANSLKNNASSKDKYLVAYYTSYSGKSIDDQKLIDHLKCSLPTYMIPTFFVHMSNFPLTINGKIDYQALPEPNINSNIQDHYVAPQNEVQAKMCQIWQEILGIEQIGIKHNFFRLGGNSILAIDAVNEMNQQLNQHYSATDIFEYSTISQLSLINKDEYLSEYPDKTIDPIELHQMEQLIVNHQLSTNQNLIYNESVVFECDQPIETEQFHQACQRLLDQFEILNSQYHIDEDGSIERVIDADKQKLICKVISVDNQNQFQDQLAAIEQQTFNISDDKLIRFYLFNLPEQQKIGISFHHLILDATSVINLLLPTFYQNLLNNAKATCLTSLQDYYQLANTINHYYQAHLETNKTYWQRQLQSLNPLTLTSLKGDISDMRGDQLTQTLGKNVTHRIQNLAEQLNISLYSVLLGLFTTVLSKTAHNQHFAIQTNIDERILAPEYNHVAGCFINNALIPAHLDTGNSIRQHLCQTANNIIATLNHLLPYSELLAIDRDLVKSLSDIHFNIETQQNHHTPYTQTQTYTHSGQVKNGLYFELDVKSDQILIRVEYQHSKYDADLVQSLLDSYTHCISHVDDILEQSLAHINLLDSANYQQIVYDWNKTDKPYPSHKTIDELFEQQAQYTPDNVAVTFNNEQLTYCQLNHQSNQLARLIKQHYQQYKTQNATKPLIALFLDKSLDMAVAIWAVLKAGAAYVPLDPQHPASRIKFILQDTNTDLVLTQSHLNKQLGTQGLTDELSLTTINLDHKPYLQEATDNLVLNHQPSDLAYIIYTSGTSGKPKGTKISHQSLCNHITTQQAQLAIEQHTKVLQFASMVFDASVWEFFNTLVRGGQLVLTPPNIRYDAEQLIQFIDYKDINIALLPPAFLNACPNAYLPSLHTLVVGGDCCTTSLMNLWSQDRCLINAYGPTESTVCISMHEYQPGDSPTNIGKPLDNVKVYVLDQHHQPVPTGIVGELYISGASLASGYLNRDDLTQERFIANKFATPNDIAQGFTHLYKTGDLVRWLPNGELEYVGRNDFQVKIRGFRIELDEIENILASHPDIKQTRVLAYNNVVDDANGHQDNQSLVAYYVSHTLQTIDHDDLILYLQISLPDYMIPSFFVALESLPLTVNGKLDTQALPHPDAAQRSNDNQYIAPQNELQAQICQIWQKLINLSSVSIHDDFFRIGGDSILAIQLTSQLRQSGFNCNVKTVFDYRTPAKISSYLQDTQVDASCPAIKSEQGLLTGEFDLLPVQQWFFNHVQIGNFRQYHHWNQAFLIKIPVYDSATLQPIIPQLAQQHDMLRVSFNWNEHTQQYQQYYQPSLALPQLKQLNVASMDEHAIDKQLTQLQNHFNITHGPLWQIAYLYGYDDGSARLFLALHHLIVDAVSWRILTDDIQTLIEAQNTYKTTYLPQKTSSYRQWVDAIKQYAQDNFDEITFWHSQLKSIPNYRTLLPRTSSNKLASSSITLTKQQTQQLLQKAPAAYHSEINDLLLTALAYTLRELNHANIQGITLEGHGREPIDSQIDLSRTVGWFTTLYPVKLQLANSIIDQIEPDSDPLLAFNIKSIKEQLRQIPNKGIGFGALAQRYDTDLSFDQLPSISFNYLGQLDANHSDNWSITNESPGQTLHADNLDSHIININGWVIEGQLNFNIVSQLTQLQTDNISQWYQNYLVEILQHCQSVTDNQRYQYTPSDLTTVTLTQSLLDQLQNNAFKHNNAIQTIFPATSLQQGFIYHALAHPDDDAYRVQVLFDYHHPLHTSHYIQAWQYAIATYPILRTAFDWQEQLIQIVYQKGQLNYKLHDLSDLANHAQQKDAIQQIQNKDRQQGFNLTQPTLLRLHLIKLAHNHWVILKSEHHSIADGWSGPILLDQVHYYYQQLQRRARPAINPDQAYLKAQHYYAQHTQQVRDYWQNQLNQIHKINDISPLLDKPHYNGGNLAKQHQQQTLTIDSDLYQALKTLTRELGITLNTVIQFIWHKLIQVYSQDEQTVVGMTTSGRDIPIDNIESSVGLYINTLPLILDWQDNQTVSQLLQQLHQKIIELNTNSFADLAELQQNGEPLFQSLVVFENYPLPQQPHDDSDKPIAHLRQAIETLEYPLSLIAYEIPGSNDEATLQFNLKYDANLISTTTIQKHLNRLANIVHDLPYKKDHLHYQIELLSKQEYQALIDADTSTRHSFPQNITIDQLFEQQVNQLPDHTAVILGDNYLSYRQLNHQANQLANYLINQHQVSTNDLVTLFLDRSLDMSIAILAILKAGAAYVPIDPDFPNDRIQYILQDTQTPVLLTQAYLKPKIQTIIEHTHLPITPLSIDQKPYQQQIATNLITRKSSNDLAYVIYTSGTTGNPKGTLITHRSLVNRLTWQQTTYNFNPNDRVLQKTPYTFDVSVWELLLPLISGSQLIFMPPHQHKEPSCLQQIIQDKAITKMHFVPSMLQAYLDNLNNHLARPTCSLTDVFCSGEALSAQLARQFKLTYPHTRLHNLYGPTEATIDVTAYNDIQGDETIIPIGKPIHNTKCLVLDKHLNPTPTGVIGELYLAGEGVAKGYLNRYELTAQRFIDNPYASEIDKTHGHDRLYKTGDLVRWLADGNIDYIGRNDFQIKIRGFRIELGDIEYNLSNYSDIKQVYVLPYSATNQHQQLIAYYMSHSGKLITENNLVQHLQKTLPDYMIPTFFMHLDAFPLTINGKLNRHALPTPDATYNADEHHYKPPENKLQATISQIWQEVLDIEHIGIEDNFFRIGGNSILAIHLSHKINETTGHNVQVSDILKHKTIKQLTQNLSVQHEEQSQQTGEEWTL